LNLLSATEAAALVCSGATVASAGFVGCGHAEAVTAALERRFLAEGAPADLTLVYSAGQGDRGHRGVNHFGHAGMTACIVGGHWRSAPKLSALALEERCAAYNLPQGVITQLYRAIAGGKPGVITKIGLHTFVDPRLDGGAINEVGREAARIGARRYVESLELRGERWLLYPSFPIDVALIRGTSVDARGNLATEHEAFHHELLAIAQAARNSGGIVIAQVERIVKAGFAEERRVKHDRLIYRLSKKFKTWDDAHTAAIELNRFKAPDGWVTLTQYARKHRRTVRGIQYRVDGMDIPVRVYKTPRPVPHYLSADLDRLLRKAP
jgi:acyl CoA:acetate/3-ketoacid CoA transferase